MKITFEQYLRQSEQLLNEKMGVISRVHQNRDVFNISYIANNFTNTIIKNPKLNYSRSYIILEEIIDIDYIPTENCTTVAKLKDGQNIKIYQEINDDTYLDVKYDIIHELIHIVQIYRKHKFKKKLEENICNDKFDELYLIRQNLRKPLEDELNDTDELRYFKYLIYREDLYEIYAWSNDAYITAYQYKCKYPDKSASDIMKLVIQQICMTQKYLNNAITNIKTNDLIWDTILSILIGHFEELGKDNSKQYYFDNFIFELPIVKTLRLVTSRILEKYKDKDIRYKYLLRMKEKYADLLLYEKDVIIKSFIKYVKQWHKEACVKLGKAIQLGIDDATIENK